MFDFNKEILEAKKSRQKFLPHENAQVQIIEDMIRTFITSDSSAIMVLDYKGASIFTYDEMYKFRVNASELLSKKTDCLIYVPIAPVSEDVLAKYYVYFYEKNFANFTMFIWESKYVIAKNF